ncbi:MAG: hypothetical protein ACI4L9_03035 [Candidatus Coproplasma sp.]
MNFTAYIQKQKNRIRERHEGEIFLVRKDGVFPLRDTSEIMKELNGLKGLNVSEREQAASIRSFRRREAEVV